jgi:hypothetical protein
VGHTAPIPLEFPKVGTGRRGVKAGSILLAALMLAALQARTAYAYEPEIPPWIGGYVEHPPGLPPPPVAPEESPASAEAHLGPPRIEAAPVVEYDHPSGRTVRIFVRGGYCVGEPPPSIQRVTLHEHRLPESTKLAAVITAFIRRPAPLEFPNADQWQVGEVPTEPIPVCEGVEHALFTRLALKRLPGELVLLDGSRSPRARIPAEPRARGSAARS